MRRRMKTLLLLSALVALTACQTKSSDVSARGYEIDVTTEMPIGIPGKMECLPGQISDALCR